MIQFNLLPTIKVEYIKAKKAKRLVIIVAGVSIVISTGLLIVMFSVVSFQKKHLSDLNKDIKSYESSLKSTPDLAKILTIQNQLNSLPDLYAKRPVVSRLFNYVQATTPVKVSISNLDMDIEAATIKVEGTADTLESVNRYADTLKFTTYTLKGDTTVLKAFSNVVLTAFSRDAKAASYTVTLSFVPDLFDSAKEVTFNVPKTITTRSETELPGNAVNGVFDSKESAK